MDQEPHTDEDDHFLWSEYYFKPKSDEEKARDIQRVNRAWATVIILSVVLAVTILWVCFKALTEVTAWVP